MFSQAEFKRTTDTSNISVSIDQLNTNFQNQVSASAMYAQHSSGYSDPSIRYVHSLPVCSVTQHFTIAPPTSMISSSNLMNAMNPVPFIQLPGTNSTARSLYPNDNSGRQNLEPKVPFNPSNPTHKLMSEADSSVAINAYTKYYTDVLAYFKTLLDNISSSDQCSNPGLPKTGTNPLKNIGETVPSPVLGCIDNDPWAQSKTIMDGYFNRHGARDWDWASWHNYLSWISRTHPEWFRLFTDCSKQMGINWDDMYQKWMKSQSVPKLQPAIFDPSCPPPMSSIQETNTQITTQFSNPLIFASVPPPQDPRIWCEDCDQYFPTEKSFDIHFRGVCHIQNALTKTITRNPSAVLDIPPPSMAQHWQQMPPPVVENFKKCLLLNAVKSTRSTDHSTQSEKRMKFVVRLQQLLNICIKPLIGLNYIVEFQRRGLLESIYTCDLCKKTFVPSAIIKHVCCVRHRMLYLKLHYPPLYYLLHGDKSSKSFKIKRLNTYAQEMENFEGRKRLSIMLEKNESSLKSYIEEPRDVHFLTRKQLPIVSKACITSPPIHKFEKQNRIKIKSSIRKSMSKSHCNDEKEDGEMTDDSSSDESQEDGDIAKIDESLVNEPQCAGQKNVGLKPLFGVNDQASLSSDNFSSEDEDEREPSTKNQNDSELPSFFSCGEEIEQSSSPTCKSQIYLQDFDIIFISDRRDVPTFNKQDKEFVLFMKHLAAQNFLNRIDDSNTISGSDLITTFQMEVSWTVKKLETLPFVPNKFKFAYDISSRQQNIPLSTGQSIQVICSSGTSNPSSTISFSSGAYDNYYEISSFPALPDVPAASTLNGQQQQQHKQQQPIPVLNPKVSHPHTTISNSPAPVISTEQRLGLQSIPVLMSTNSQPLKASLFQSLKPQQVPSTVMKRDGVLGTPPIKEKQSAIGAEMSPLEALQCLLKGGFNANKKFTTPPPTTPSILPSSELTNPLSLLSQSGEIFDGYSFFEKRKRINEPTPIVEAHDYHHRPFRPSTSNASLVTPSRKKLAAFADMLGVNEPPSPAPPPPPPKLMDSLNLPATEHFLAQLQAAQCAAALFGTNSMTGANVNPLSGGSFLSSLLFGNNGSLLGNPNWSNPNAGHRPR